MTKRICCAPDSPADENLDNIPDKEIEKLIDEGFGNRAFEEELVKKYRDNEVPSPASFRSKWIKGHLEDEGADYPLRMWKCFYAFLKVQDLDFETGDYYDFDNCLYRLRELNLVSSNINEGGNENSGSLNRIRVPHSLVKDNLDWNIAWENPLKIIYPHSWKPWVRLKLKEGLSPAEIAERAEEITPRKIEVSEEKVLRKIEKWNLNWESG